LVGWLVNFVTVYAERKGMFEIHAGQLVCN